MRDLKQHIADLTAEERTELLSQLDADTRLAELTQLESDLLLVKTLPERVNIKTRMQELRGIRK